MLARGHRRWEALRQLPRGQLTRMNRKAPPAPTWVAGDMLR